MNSATDSFRLESECRRRGWSTGGVALRLADAERWHLPALTGSLLARMPELRDDLRAMLAVTVWNDPPEPTRSDAANLALFCDRMAAVARTLLRANYELPDYTWRALMTFNDPIGVFGMMMSLSSALDLAWDEWRPWVDASATRPTASA